MGLIKKESSKIIINSIWQRFYNNNSKLYKLYWYNKLSRIKLYSFI